MNSVEVYTSLDEASYINGDQNQFQQFIVNILKNSIEALSLGGELRIRWFEKDETAYLEICDTGIGMSKEQILRLGEPYYSTKGSKGTGLGMMVSFGIYSRHEWDCKKSKVKSMQVRNL